MEDYLKKDFGKILKSSGLEARRWMKNTDSSTSRVYDRNLEELPLTVDLYGEYARVVDFSPEGLSDEERADVEDIISRFLYVEKSKVIYACRRKREGHEQHEKGEEECPVTVKENSLVFECELKKYVDTGLFLDAEETRKLVREMAFNQRVLNLFCYTASFSVYAASALAEKVVSVDLSNVYSAWGRRNLNNNGFLDETKYPVITCDARDYLKEAVEKKEQFDLVIFDPPAFSNSHKAEEFDVQKDYVTFLTMIYHLLSDGGVVIFSENLSGFRFEKNKIQSMYEAEELTSSLFALNFSHKRKGMRVWALKKVSEKKHERIERKMSEKLERFEVEIDDSLPQKRRAKKETRSFTFEDEDNKEERRESRYDERRSRDNNKERSERSSYEERKRSSRYTDKRYSDRDNRYSDRSSSRYDERRYSDKDGRYSDRKTSRYDDRRYSDRDNRYSDKTSSRYDERRYSDRESSPRYSERDSYRSGDDRRRDYKRDDSRRGDSWSKRGEHTSFERRDADGRRSSYKRASYSSERSDRRDDRRSGDGRKKSSPKPFGYDSFMENKNRAGATTRWLEEQEYIEKKED